MSNIKMSNTMNKVVMLFTEGDGCSYSFISTCPIYYSSPEQARVDFDALCSLAHSKKPNWSEVKFEFCGMEFDSKTFYSNGRYFPPDFLTIDEWFDQQGSQT